MSIVTWLPAAVRDSEEVFAWISADDPGAAERLLSRVDRAVAHLSRFPRAGRLVPELERLGVLTYRELVVPPLRVVYRAGAGKVVVVLVVDSRRDVEQVLIRRLSGL